MVSLASATASASSRKGMTAATGPKISSRAARSSLLTGHSTVAGNQNPGPPGASPRIATGASSSTKELTCSRCAALMSGPICVSSSSGSPTRSAPTASSSASMKRSSAPRSTRIRERAQQSWPALPNTASGAIAAACSRSASANTTSALLPPSSSVTRLIVAAAPAAIERPTSVEPVKAIFAASGGSTGRRPPARGGPAEPPPRWRAGSGHDLQDARRQPGLQRQLGEAQRGQRRQLRGLEHDRVAGGQRGPQLPRGDHEREVPRHDQPTHAGRLAHREAVPAGDGDRVAEQPLRRARVVAEDVGDHADLAARVADRLAGVARLEYRELLAVLLDDGAQPREQ